MNFKSTYFFQKSSAFLEQFPMLRKQWLSVGVAMCSGFVVLLFAFQSGPKAPAFVQAESLFAAWEATPQDAVLSQKMFSALKKVPSLQQKYEAVIAQKLIEGGKGAEALQIAYRALELSRNETPLHAVFAETSLLIEQGDYQTALQRAVALRERMLQECNVGQFVGDQLVSGALLYTHNLLRVAYLQQELKNQPGEMAAWDEVERFLYQNKTSPLIHRIFNGFQAEGVNLFQYIQERKAVLAGT